MIVCKKKHCIWRVECGEGKAVCSVYRCPYAKNYINDLPKIKWVGLIKKVPKYTYNASKRNKKGNND